MFPMPEKAATVLALGVLVLLALQQRFGCQANNSPEPTLIAVVDPPVVHGYGSWTKNAARNRLECVYTYETRDGGTNTQTVIVYPKGSDRHGWAYYFNSQGKPWARCAAPGHADYNPKQMLWQKLNAAGDGYERFPNQSAGFCPTPKDGKLPIPELPDPPR